MALWPNIGKQINAKQSAIAAQRQQQDAAAANRALSQLYAQQAGLGLAAQSARNLLGYPAQPKFKPSDAFPNTLGWRTWVWDITTNELRSPVQGTAWNGTELRCETWDESDVIRGAAGIHAHLVPDNWHKLVVPEAPNQGRAYAETRNGSFRACIAIQGVVERFGRFVLGTEGWRAEWVQIRRLAAPTEEIGLSLEAVFPEVEIVYGNR